MFLWRAWALFLWGWLQMTKNAKFTFFFFNLRNCKWNDYMLVNSKRWKLIKYCLIELVCIFSFDSESERSFFPRGRGGGGWCEDGGSFQGGSYCLSSSKWGWGRVIWFLGEATLCWNNFKIKWRFIIKTCLINCIF